MTAAVINPIRSQNKDRASRLRNGVLALLIFVGGWAAPRIAAAEATNAVSEAAAEHEALYRDIATLTEALLLVKNHYVEDKPYRELLHGAINGMLQALDPHSGFLDERAFNALREDTAGQFPGIGIHVGMRNGQLTVVAPIDGSPAFREGLLPGDRIMRVNGERTAGMSIEDAVHRLRGERGTSVTLSIRRSDQDPFDVTIERDDIKIASVRSARMLDEHVGYVRLTQFSEPAGREFEEALKTLKAQSMRALILDLRNNSGGLLSAAVEVAEQLLPRRALIVSTLGRDGSTPLDERFAADPDPLTDLPVAVLINPGSASAAEIVAGALQDHRRAVIVGETSFGKASVQNIVPLRASPDSAVRLTTGFYHTPGGRLIHGKGIDPDWVVEMSPSQWRQVQLKRDLEANPDWFRESDQEVDDSVEDTQLLRAMEALRVAMIFSASASR